jgi:hypothetical protein
MAVTLYTTIMTSTESAAGVNVEPETVEKLPALVVSSIAYSADINVVALQIFENSRVFDKMISNLPASEFNRLIFLAKKALTEDGYFDFLRNNSPVSLRASILSTRYANRICNHCWNKADPSKLLVCSKCELVFYCNEACQKADWTADTICFPERYEKGAKQCHKNWCCNSKATYDRGPLRVAIGKLAETK